MRWFKHDTDASMSEGVDALMSEFGFAGYGRWMKLLEIVAAKMDGSNRCFVEYSANKWRSLLGLKQKQLTLFLQATENKLKTKVVYCGNIIKIEIPNLLKKRDEWSSRLGRDSGETPSCYESASVSASASASVSVFNNKIYRGEEDSRELRCSDGEIF